MENCMTTKNKPGSDLLSEPEALAPEEQPRPHTMPTEGDGVREVGKRVLDDMRSGRKDTDQAGRDEQRSKAPPDSPIRRSGTEDGSDS
jgi:hypothetical protein